MVKPYLWTRASKFHALMGDDASYLSQLVHDELRVVVRDGLDLDANISIFGSANICERNASKRRSYICVYHLPMIYSLSRSMSNLGPSWPVFLRTTICSDGAFTSSDGAFSDGAFTSSDGAFSDGAVGKVVSESAAARVGTAKGKSARRSQREQHVRDAVHLPD